jgi:flagellar biogenesis protein FliO
MRRTLTMRSIAGHCALLWLLGCIHGLSAQDVATPQNPTALAAPPRTDAVETRRDATPEQLAAHSPASNSWSPPAATPDAGASAATNSASAEPARAVQTGSAWGESTARAGRESPLPLKPPAHDTGGRLAAGQRADGAQSLVAVAGSLAAVLGVFFVLAWVMRRTTPAAPGALPDEVFAVLGRGALANRQQVQLLRCGNKLLLVSVTATGAETLTEISDFEEVERLTAACRPSRSRGAPAAFQRVLDQWNTRRLAHEALSGVDLSDLDRSLAAERSDQRAWGDNV